MKFRKKPVVIEATQWFKNGDHPEDGMDTFDYIDRQGQVSQSPCEGKIVRYFRHPLRNPNLICSECKRLMDKHGWIDTLEGGHIVCPGDFIITGVKGEHYPCKPDIFEMTYEAVP